MTAQLSFPVCCLPGCKAIVAEWGDACATCQNDFGAFEVVGNIFTAARAGIVETFGCSACGRPAVLVAGVRDHFEQLPNGAKTSWRDCKPADVAMAPTLF